MIVKVYYNSVMQKLLRRKLRYQTSDVRVMRKMFEMCKLSVCYLSETMLWRKILGLVSGNIVEFVVVISI